MASVSSGVQQDPKQDDTIGPDQGQASKLETVGRLASGVAHDFANILTLISGYTDLLLERGGVSGGGNTELEEIRRAAHRGSTLVAQLLGFTRAQSVEPKALSINAVVTDVERMLRPLIGEGIQVKLDLGPDAGKVLADPVQLDQVLMNVLLNARDAMPGGGTISITTRNTELDATTAPIYEMAAGQTITLTISDTGQGIEPGAMLHLFEPFFTTKPMGKGVGLGLSTVRQIVHGCGGAVWATSGRGGGATFHVCLPRINPALEIRDAGPERHSSSQGSEIVLIVEDEESVRRLLTHVLRNRGYRVLEACDGEEALTRFHEHADEIELVLTDVVMPNLGGPDLAQRLLEIRPDLPLIFMSGYPDDRLGGAGSLPPGRRFLRKPLMPEALASAVRETLDSVSRPFNPQ